MPLAPAPIDRMALWATEEGAALRARVVELLQAGRSLVSLGPELDLTGIDLAGVRLVSADLTGARLMHARLAGADLTGAPLSGASLYAASAMGAVLDRASLAGADLAVGNFTRVSLRFADLRQARLAGATLYSADLIGADLRGVDLSLCDLEDAWLIGAERDPPARRVRDELAEDAERKGFPSFVPALRGARYLAIKNLSFPAITLRRIESIVLVCREIEAEMKALLGDRDWRSHMVAAAAMTHGAAAPAILAAARERLDLGSWAAPQLAAALFLVELELAPDAGAKLLATGEREGRITRRWLAKLCEVAAPPVRARWARRPS